MKGQSKAIGALAVLVLAIAVIACSLGDRLKPSGPILLRSSAERAATKARFAPDKSERTGILTYQFK